MTKKEIDTILSACRFNPKAPSALKVISETGNNDYFKRRAIEMIHETFYQPVSPTEVEQNENRLKMAIQLLAMATVTEFQRVVVFGE